ncbi:hypothetical protein SADUNF_Sadunf15G0009700 [Salix dunnii]|uniref:Uncharacterized protein n=1 Tax=Salix dunnii TaxID=1413687 RepID=A0A835MNC0_9ROSI|nr:hypothetical protein SADUNF_Sadunf15G0009700 [Salix dunnii]
MKFVGIGMRAIFKEVADAELGIGVGTGLASNMLIRFSKHGFILARMCESLRCGGRFGLTVERKIEVYVGERWWKELWQWILERQKGIKRREAERGMTVKEFSPKTLKTSLKNPRVASQSIDIYAAQCDKCLK